MREARDGSTPRSRNRLGVLGAALVALACLTSPLAAQSVRVRVIDDVSGQPVVGALATLLAEDGAALAEGITDGGGRRTLTTPAAATVRVWVRRIGYAPYTSAPVRLVAGVVTPLELRVPSSRVSLAAVVVSGRARCGRAWHDDGEVAALWEQIRTALALTSVTRAQGATRVETRTFTRRVSPRGRVVEEEIAPPRVTIARPFVARPTAALTLLGYVERDASSTTYYAPDDVVLLSEEFAAEHCFTVVEGAGARAGQVGLRFAPAPDRRVADIAGTLWADAATAELRALEFRFVDPLAPRAATEAGGHLEFARLPSGAWIVRDWVLRMPRLRQRGSGQGAAAHELDHWLEVGGVAAAGAVTVARAAPGRIGGVVWDSLAGAPAAGVVVTVVRAAGGAAVATDTTDARGAWEVAVPPGRYVTTFARVDLDALGLGGRAELEVASGEHSPLDLATPSAATLRGSCGDGGNITGRVVDAATAAPLVNAVAVVAWTEITTPAAGGMLPRVERRQLQASTDSMGRYRACGAPVDVLVTVQAFADEAWASGIVDATLGPRAFLRRDLLVHRGGAATAVLAGTARDERGLPLAGARIVVEGSDAETRADSAGRFLLTRLPAGTTTAEARLIGWMPARRGVDLRPTDTARVAFTLARAPVLDTVRISARAGPAAARMLAGVEERRRLGLSRVVPRAELERIAETRSVFNGIPGIRVQYVGATGPLPPGIRDLFPRPPYIVVGAMQSLGGGPCQANIYVDGTLLRNHAMLQGYHPRHFVAVEVYPRGAQAPAQYQPTDNACAVILIWTETAP